MTQAEISLGEPRTAAHAPTTSAPLCNLVDERTRDLIARRRLGKGRRRGWLIRRALAAADLVGLLLAFGLAQAITTDLPIAGSNRVPTQIELLAFLFTLPAWIVVARLYGLYSRDEEHANHTAIDEAVSVFTMLSVGTFGLLALSYATGLADPFIPKVLAFWAAAVVLITAGRALARRACRRSTTYLQNTIIIGAGDIGQLLGSKILRHPEYGLNLLGFVDMQPRNRRNDLGDLTVLGGLEDVSRIVDELAVERVIVAFAGQAQGQLMEDLRPLRARDVQIDVAPRFFDIIGPGADFHAIEGFPLVGLAPARLPLSSLILKRVLDLVGSVLGLLILSPYFAYLALRIKLDSPGPVFYRHERLGRGGRPIEIFKFRTMEIEFCRGARYGGEKADRTFDELMRDPEHQQEFETSQKLRDDPRVTRFGARLRRSSFDELPQLINVLTGDLSLVGPRPITPRELDRYGSAGAELLNVKPGLTGYWQINGRSDLDYADRVRLDLAYAGDWSVGLDLTILAKTIRVLAAGQGAY